jgi:hypothetical protein
MDDFCHLLPVEFCSVNQYYAQLRGLPSLVCPLDNLTTFAFVYINLEDDFTKL